MRKQRQVFYFSLLFYVLSALGISLTIIANIGVSSFNSVNLSISEWASIKVGNVTILSNFSFLIVCWLLDKNRKMKEYLFVSVALLLFGSVVNFFVYYVFSGWTIPNYSLRVLLFLSGVIIAGFGTGQVLRLKFLRFPIEHLCLILSRKTKRNFSFYRYGIDIICVGLSVLMTISFELPLFVREGTVISLAVLSYVIGLSKEVSLKKFLNG